MRVKKRLQIIVMNVDKCISIFLKERNNGETRFDIL